MLIAQRRLIAQRCCWRRFHRGLAHARYRQWTSDLLALRWRRLVLRFKAQNDWIVGIEVRPHWNYSQWTSDLLALRWRRSVLRLMERIDRIDQLLWDMDLLFLRWRRLAHRCRARNNRIDRSLRRALWQSARPLMEGTCHRRMVTQTQTPIHSCAYRTGLSCLRWATTQWWSALWRIRASRAVQMAFELWPDTGADRAQSSDSTDTQQ